MAHASGSAEPRTPVSKIRVSKRFLVATEWAAQHHALRADTASRRMTPSLGQVLGIASLVLEDGGTEREAIAAMILDALGDDRPAKAEIRALFGKKVARLVRGGAIVRPDPRHLRDPAAWQERRAQSLRRLEQDPDASLVRVRAADTLRELRVLVTDLRRHGSIAFARFPTPPAEQLAYYRDLLAVCTQRLPRGHLTQELRAIVTEMERLVELDTATAAWRVAHVDAA